MRRVPRDGWIVNSLLGRSLTGRGRVGAKRARGDWSRALQHIRQAHVDASGGENMARLPSMSDRKAQTSVEAR